jgi:diguanylate cyclase (GGDEF)-like protein/PAS domain S-box-containing protein
MACQTFNPWRRLFQAGQGPRNDDNTGSGNGLNGHASSRGGGKAVIDPAGIYGSKILIVSDQESNIRLIEKMLQQAGYLCVSSTMDLSAVCTLHLKNRYDLILLDLQQPRSDGFQVLAALKEIEPEDYLPVLVIAAQSSLRQNALEAGAKDFISDTRDRSEVLTRIFNMVEIRLLHGALKDHSKAMEEAVLARTAELRKSEEMFRELAANIPEALWIRDSEKQTLEYANPAWQKLSGLHASPGDPVAKAYQTIHPDDMQRIANERRRASTAHVNNEYRLIRPDQSVRWVHARTFSIANPVGKTPWVAEIIEDVTKSREVQQQLVHLARHDGLTGLPNRMFLYESLREALLRATEDQLIVSVLLLDIDYFKHVNDSLGHIIGDELLREFATRLAGCVRPGDTAGRLGGDEFAVVVVTPAHSNGAVDVANRIRHSLQKPFMLRDKSIAVTASIGIASYPTDTSDIETLIRYADAALYEAKSSGRDTSRCFSAELNARAIAKADIEGALRIAQGRDEFILHYQPKMQIDSGQLSSAEALIRWNRPGHGMVLPGFFIPALEESGLIVPVGAWVIDTACRQIHDWERSGIGPVRIAVNVSPRQLREERFVPQVANVVREHSIDPKLLEFEITENTLMAHDEFSDANLRRLKDLGISISIDDFGTGYSNLAYLKRFQVDAIKIDIAFIRDITTNANDAAIATAIINMAHSLRLRVIAEGVETREQLDFLRVYGCDEAQGYFFSKPLPVEELSEKFRRIAAYDTATPFDLQENREILTDA